MIELFVTLAFCFIIIESWIFTNLIIENIKSKKRNRYVTNFPSYKLVLDYFTEKAYEMVHKDRMLIYSIEAIKVSDKDFNTYAKEFAKLTMALMGPMFQKEFSDMFGDEDAFLSNLIEFFSTKYEDDEIRKAALENLMTDEPVEEKPT